MWAVTINQNTSIEKSRMKTRSISKCFIVCSIIALTGCATTAPPTRYLPDSEQKTQGNLTDAPAKGKFVVEFTTNTDETASFTEYKGGTVCVPEERTRIASVGRQRILEETEKNMRTLGAVLSLGLTKIVDPRTEFNKQFHVVAKEYDMRETFVTVSSSFANLGNQTISCGPVFVKFWPEEGQRYRVNFLRTGGQCGAELTQASNGTYTPVARRASWFCSASFLGVGGGEIINYRELPAPKKADPK